MRNIIAPVLSLLVGLSESPVRAQEKLSPPVLEQRADTARSVEVVMQEQKPRSIRFRRNGNLPTTLSIPSGTYSLYDFGNLTGSVRFESPEPFMIEKGGADISPEGQIGVGLVEWKGAEKTEQGYVLELPPGFFQRRTTSKAEGVELELYDFWLQVFSRSERVPLRIVPSDHLSVDQPQPSSQQSASSCASQVADVFTALRSIQEACAHATDAERCQVIIPVLENAQAGITCEGGRESIQSTITSLRETYCEPKEQPVESPPIKKGNLFGKEPR